MVSYNLKTSVRSYYQFCAYTIPAINGIHLSPTEIKVVGELMYQYSKIKAVPLEDRKLIVMNKRDEMCSVLKVSKAIFSNTLVALRKKKGKNGVIIDEDNNFNEHYQFDYNLEPQLTFSFKLNEKT